MANQADTKLAILGVLLTMGHPDDLGRVLTFSLHLLKKRNRQTAEQQLSYMTRDGS